MQINALHCFLRFTILPFTYVGVKIQNEGNATLVNIFQTHSFGSIAFPTFALSSCCYINFLRIRLTDK